jgi:hypothetical protein
MLRAGCKRVHHIGAGSPASDQIHEDSIGWKAPHPDHVIDALAAPAQLQRAASLVRDRHDPEVDLWGEPPIQPHLFVAEVVAELGCAEVEEGEADGLLELVDIRPSEEDVRDMRLHMLHSLRPMRVEGRILKRPDDFLLAHAIQLADLYERTARASMP